MAGQNVTITFTAHDRVNGRCLYIKADGKRFGSSQTLKVCCDVKYDVTVTVKPPLQKLEKLVIGGEEILPDSSKGSDASCEYKFCWLTNGFQPTKSGNRDDLNITFKFENADVVNSFQVKFYAQEKASHITWGTEVRRLELEVRGINSGTGATPHKTLAPTNVVFK